MYTAHPSAALNSLFKNKPYQGADPREAEFLFVGLDTGYVEQIEQSSIFPRVLEYHEDGIAFWRRHRVHHPFLLDEYTGEDQFHHSSFARIGFKPEHAHRVSRVDLLHVPTTGRSKLVPSDLDWSHLRMLNDLLLNGHARHIFIPSGAERLMHATKEFGWLSKLPTEYVGPLGILYRRGAKAVYSHLNFSVFGKYEQRKVDEAAVIQGLLAKSN